MGLLPAVLNNHQPLPMETLVPLQHMELELPLLLMEILELPVMEPQALHMELLELLELLPVMEHLEPTLTELQVPPEPPSMDKELQVF